MGGVVDGEPVFVPDSACQRGKNEIPASAAEIQRAQSACIYSQPPVPLPLSHSIDSSCLTKAKGDISQNH